jgi:hypothetical protein
MVTLGLLFAQWWIMLMASFSGSTYGGRMFSYSLMDAFSYTMRSLTAAAGRMRVYTVVMWASALLFGATAVGLRVALEALNRFAARR